MIVGICGQTGEDGGLGLLSGNCRLLMGRGRGGGEIPPGFGSRKTLREAVQLPEHLKSQGKWLTSIRPSSMS